MNLTSIQKEFDEQFFVQKYPSGEEFGITVTPDNIKGFFKSSLTSLLKGLEMEKKDIPDITAQYPTPDELMQVYGNTGYNQAVQELNQKIAKLLL